MKFGFANRIDSQIEPPTTGIITVRNNRCRKSLTDWQAGRFKVFPVAPFLLSGMELKIMFACVHLGWNESPSCA
jgi:hypothetical protein